ncbi:MAG TPA: alkaline phosphatase family protein [Allosphingosinicella sp.]|nr:alkaline phosphatase family protein [Allosphingosinicella sp.]
MALKDIDTFVFCMLENRSFDHMLGYLSLDDAPRKLPVDGLRSDPAWQASWRNRGDGVPFPLKPLVLADAIDDPPHGRERIKLQIETPAEGHPHMGGFVQAYINSRRESGRPIPTDPGAVMGYYKADSVGTYDFLARNYCVCDRWFAPVPLGTQANKLMAMAGESKVLDNETGLPNQQLVYNWLKRNKVKWRVYQSGKFFPFFMMMEIWTAPIAASLLSGRGRFRRYTRFKKDWTTAKEMPSVIFVEPDYTDSFGSTANDDHPPTGIGGGQDLVRDLYETLTSNTERWARTLLIVTYDEHGGFFDHVPPLPVTTRIRDRLLPTTGPRVPALLVSPHVGRGTVFSEKLDHTAFLQLLAERFTPGQGYSLAVNERLAQNVLGRLSNALKGTPRTGKPPKMGEELEFKAVQPQGPAGASNTPMGVAFFEAAQRLEREHPELVDAEMKAALAAQPPPEPRGGDHIPDAPVR